MPFDKNDFYARTMHRPDTPDRAALREALREVSKALIPLHRALIDAAKEDYAFVVGPVASPSELLRLIKDAPFFAWLKPVTALIVDIDEMARKDFERADSAAIADRVDRLFGASPDPAFSEQYVPLLQRDVDVTMGHAAVRQAVQKLRRSQGAP